MTRRMNQWGSGRRKSPRGACYDLADAADGLWGRDWAGRVGCTVPVDGMTWHGMARDGIIHVVHEVSWAAIHTITYLACSWPPVSVSPGAGKDDGRLCGAGDVMTGMVSCMKICLT
jgi:hypothetical protein